MLESEMMSTGSVRVMLHYDDNYTTFVAKYNAAKKDMFQLVSLFIFFRRKIKEEILHINIRIKK